MLRIGLLTVFVGVFAVPMRSAKADEGLPDNIVTFTVRGPGGHVTVDRKGNVTAGPAIDVGYGLWGVGVQVNVPIRKVEPFRPAPSGRWFRPSPSYPQPRRNNPQLHPSYPRARPSNPQVYPNYPQARPSALWVHPTYPRTSPNYPQARPSYPQNRTVYRSNVYRG